MRLSLKTMTWSCAEENYDSATAGRCLGGKDNACVEGHVSAAKLLHVPEARVRRRCSVLTLLARHEAHRGELVARPRACA